MLKVIHIDEVVLDRQRAQREQVMNDKIIRIIARHNQFGQRGLDTVIVFLIVRENKLDVEQLFDVHIALENGILDNVAAFLFLMLDRIIGRTETVVIVCGNKHTDFLTAEVKAFKRIGFCCCFFHCRGIARRRIGLHIRDRRITAAGCKGKGTCRHQRSKQ